MAAAKFELCALLALVVCASLVLSGVPLLESCNANKAGLFIFGDSLYDPGNNNYINTTTEFQANFWPYGKSFFNAPTGRFSDGRLIPDFIAEYAKLPLIPPYLQPGNHQFLFGANFASGGAGALDQTYAGLVVNLRTQLSQFKNVAKQLTQQLGDTEAAELLSDSVYMISIGGNDYLSPARGDSKQSYTRQQFVDMVIGNFSTVIKEIFKKGGRKFSFISLPPLGCWPSIKAQRAGKSSNPCDEDLAALVQQHMEAFSKNLNKLEKQLKGVEYSYFDLHTSFSDKMANPSKYGLKDGSSACCGSGPYRGVYSCGGMRGEKEYELCENVSDYLFFDSYHPTQVAYQQLAKLMWEGSPIVAGPNNLKSLFEVSNKRGPKVV